MFTRPHRVSHLTFILYSLDLLYKVTYIFQAFACIVALPPYTALVSSFCTSSQNFDTHFLHFHLTMDSLCFSNWLAIYTSNTDLHRLVKRHACRTIKIEPILYFVVLTPFFLIFFIYFMKLKIDPLLHNRLNNKAINKFLLSIIVSILPSILSLFYIIVLCLETFVN